MGHRRPKCRLATDFMLAGVVLASLVSHSAAQQAGITASITGLQPAALTTYNWTVTNTVDKPSITLQVGDNNGFATVLYTISYTRARNQQQTYVLTGNVNVIDADGQSNVITQPTITVLTASRGAVMVPASSINCPSLTVPANGQISCTFSISYTGDQPLPGSLSAAVTVAGTSNTATSPPVQYDFAGALVSEVGGLATISSYFEQGPAILQPYGVSGSQPPPGLTVSDDTTYTFTAFYGNIPASQCGPAQLTAVNTAQVTPTGTGATSNSSSTAASTVTINLLGCNTAAGPAPGFSETSPAPTAPAPAVPAATPPPAAAPGPAGTGGTAPRGVTFAEAGSTLCGSGVCAPGQRCFDGWNCCDTDVDICGGVCCDGGRVCLNSQCVAAGSTTCGTNVCLPGQICTNGVCCSSTQQVCGAACCDVGQVCVLGQCAPTGSTACGTTNICGPTQQCVGGTCCDTGDTVCAGKCCPSGNTCLGGQFCVPVGSTLCGGNVCPATQQCAGGILCCDIGATFCGGSCCPSGNTCQGNQCLAPGNTLCGASTVCTSTQTCQGSTVCCDQGATFCNGGCCGQGNVCINNQCVPSGSTACGATVICPINQFCGNPTTGTCCQANNQIGCWNTCCNLADQICNQLTQQCVSRFNTNCGVGTVWCPSANVCCPVGQLCYLGQCLPRNAVPGRRMRSF